VTEELGGFVEGGKLFQYRNNNKKGSNDSGRILKSVRRAGGERSHAYTRQDSELKRRNLNFAKLR